MIELFLSRVSISWLELGAIVLLSALIGGGLTATLFRYQRTRKRKELVRFVSGMLLLGGLTLWIVGSLIGFWLVLLSGLLSFTVDLSEWKQIITHKANDLVEKKR